MYEGYWNLPVIWTYFNVVLVSGCLLFGLLGTGKLDSSGDDDFFGGNLEEFHPFYVRAAVLFALETGHYFYEFFVRGFF